MDYRKRRLKKHGVQLDITAFMNLIVVLVPFLLTSVVFSRIAILEMNLPAAAAGPTDIKPQHLQLEVIIRPNALEVSDRNSGMIKSVASNAQGYDYPALSEVMQLLKSRFPDILEATILSEPQTSYDTLVQVMDTVRTVRTSTTGASVYRELFPEISIGDAPPAGDIKPSSKPGLAS